MALLPLAATCLGIGIAFALAGAWMVLPFAGIEVAALGAAFRLHRRHAGDYERIALSAGRLTIEVLEGRRLRRSELNSAWVRLAEHERACDYRLALLAHGRQIEIGKTLDEGRRRALAAALRWQLRNTTAGAARPRPDTAQGLENDGPDKE